MLKTLGITIHGSLHDYLHQPAHREPNDKLLHRETSTVHAQMSTRDHLTSTNEAAAGVYHNTVVALRMLMLSK